VCLCKIHRVCLDVWQLTALKMQLQCSKVSTCVPVKANSHIPCCYHAALIHTFHAVPLPFSDSAMSFVKVRMVDGNILTASPATILYSDNLHGILCGSWKKPNMGRLPTCCFWTVDANSHLPRRSHATLCHGLEKSLSERYGHGMAWEHHGCGMAGERHRNGMVFVN
jgi:hypothetical protein